MKKFTLIAVLLLTGVIVFAGPHGHRHGGRHHGHYHGNDGVWLAAGITNIVANGLSIVNTVAAPRVVVAPAPVYQQPVVIPQPVYQNPVYVQPQPVVVPRPAPAVYYPPQPVYTQSVVQYQPVYAPPVPVVTRHRVYRCW